jgi:hypothetical protein
MLDAPRRRFLPSSEPSASPYEVVSGRLGIRGVFSVSGALRVGNDFHLISSQVPGEPSDNPDGTSGKLSYQATQS